MEKQPELPDLPEAPETPEWLKTVHWIVHHLTSEGQVIRQAPVAFLVMSGLIAYGWHWYENGRFEERAYHLNELISTKDATIQSEDVSAKNQNTTIVNLQGTIVQLQERLKGTSPQLAAIQAGRDKLRAKLQGCYAESGDLLNRIITTPTEVDTLDADTETWAKACAKWIEDNMGVAARERFLSRSNG